MFAVLLVLQARGLPARRGGAGKAEQSMLADWRQAATNRSFLLFSLAMSASYVLNFQVYLGLPIEVRRVTGGQVGVAVLFAVSGLLTIAGQVPLTAWVKTRWTPEQAITRGLLVMAASFTPLAAAAVAAGHRPVGADGWLPSAVALAPVLTSAALLTVATMIVYPFEMATIVNLAGPRTVGTHYGLYNTIAGIGIAVGTMLTGAAIDAGTHLGAPVLPWITLTVLGLLSAAAIRRLGRRGRLRVGDGDGRVRQVPARCPGPRAAAP